MFHHCSVSNFCKVNYLHLNVVLSFFAIVENGSLEFLIFKTSVPNPVGFAFLALGSGSAIKMVRSDSAKAFFNILLVAHSPTHCSDYGFYTRWLLISLCAHIE